MFAIIATVANGAVRLSIGLRLGIVIPGSRIPGLAKPKCRDFGIEKNCIFQLKPAYIP